MTKQDIEQLFNTSTSAQTTTQQVHKPTPPTPPLNTELHFSDYDEELEKVLKASLGKPLLSKEEIDRAIYSSPSSSFDNLISLAKKTTPEAISHHLERLNDPENNELYVSLLEAEYLNPKQKELFLEMTRAFVKDSKTNLFLDQFALNELYPKYSLDNWVDYLSDRVVSSYITKHRKVRMKSIAELQLINPDTSNKAQSLKMLKDLETTKKDNNIVIYRIPLVENKEDII